MIQTSVTLLLHALIIKRNRQSNNNKWAVRFRALIDNTVAIEHKYRPSLSIKIGDNYKREEQQNQKVHTNTKPKIHS